MPRSAVERMVSDVSWAISRGLPKRDLLAMLKRLIASAAPGSPEQSFAKLELSELVVGDEPFRAARLALDVLKEEGPEPRAFGVLGIAHSLLGNFRAARRAYERAVELEPEHPAYRHNLGHLLDIAFDRPREALRHLALARRVRPSEPAIVTSEAHALTRAGQAARAVQLLERTLGWSHAEAESRVEGWLAATPNARD
ncbi:MAG TPA: tetratricopeptide repeat protein [Polyangiaceae bacterium]|nr:tetratricopeptide repeat protein [Polyangiaceae bacterium]